MFLQDVFFFFQFQHVTFESCLFSNHKKNSSTVGHLIYSVLFLQWGLSFLGFCMWKSYIEKAKAMTSYSLFCGLLKVILLAMMRMKGKERYGLRMICAELCMKANASPFHWMWNTLTTDSRILEVLWVFFGSLVPGAASVTLKLHSITNKLVLQN